MKLQINDILFTKDGRKAGNLTVVDVQRMNDAEIYTCMSDYGNPLKISSENEMKYHYKTLGKAKGDHKFFNYKELNPEEFI